MDRSADRLHEATEESFGIGILEVVVLEGVIRREQGEVVSIGREGGMSDFVLAAAVDKIFQQGHSWEYTGTYAFSPLPSRLTSLMRLRLHPQSSITETSANYLYPHLR